MTARRAGLASVALLLASPATLSAASFERVYQAVFSDPYASLPHYEVTTSDFGPRGSRPENRLRTAAIRTLSSTADLFEFPGGRKLFQPNGICFRGEWRIDADAGYTGLYAAGQRVPAIVRASVMLGGTQRADRRAFGLAIKLFPDPLLEAEGGTVNLVLMESMGGRYLDHVLDAVVDNEPGFGGLPSLVRIGTLLRLRRDLTAADRVRSGAKAQLRFRSVAAPGATGNGALQAPHWLRLRAAPGHARVTADDFRDELSVSRYPTGEIVYFIDVADRADGGKQHAHWQSLGTLVLSESVTSFTCDTRLHFHHPGAG